MPLLRISPTVGLKNPSLSKTENSPTVMDKTLSGLVVATMHPSFGWTFVGSMLESESAELDEE